MVQLISLIVFVALTPSLLVYASAPGDNQARPEINQIDQVKNKLTQIIENVAKKVNKVDAPFSGNSAPVVIPAQVENNKTSPEKKQSSAEKKQNKVPKEIVDMKEVEKQAEFASQVTGVRKEFLMGMLVVESDLGKNTGKCTYQEVKAGAEKAHEKGLLSKRAWQTFQERKKIIGDIADNLGYDAEQLRVSCNPDYAGTGGAMGIPQFMPDTWMEYKDRISSIVGTSDPDPWNVRDGVLAMALKVSDVPGVTDHNVWAERAASKLYLSGTTSVSYDWYASQIQYWARNYGQLIG
ncbi:MAG: lytic murein transglycosylase [Parcubacteria group bacterium]